MGRSKVQFLKETGGFAAFETPADWAARMERIASLRTKIKKGKATEETITALAAELGILDNLTDYLKD